jgi:hypothetical protein
MTEYKNFQGPTFKLNIPTDWLITSSPDIQAAFVAPAINKGEIDVRSNMIVSMRRLKKGVTINAVADAAKSSQEKEYTDYLLLAEKDLTKDGVAGFQRTFKWHKPDKVVGVLQQQTFFQASNMLYTLTSTRPDIDSLAEIDLIFGEMVQTFKVELTTIES